MHVHLPSVVSFQSFSGIFEILGGWERFGVENAVKNELKSHSIPCPLHALHVNVCSTLCVAVVCIFCLIKKSIYIIIDIILFDQIRRDETNEQQQQHNSQK